MLNQKFKLAISMDFFKAYSEIPKKEQKDVRDFMKAFEENPTASRFNYENIEACPDKNFKSVRINYTYRAIVLKPQKGNVYVLLWVDHHDKAYRWARTKKAGINAEFGGIQVYTDPVYEQIAKEQKQLVQEQERLFHNFHDRELKKIGVTDELIASVRDIRNEDELEAKQSEYPSAIYESIFKLACGFSIQEIEIERIGTEPPAAIDEDDFEAALETDDSKQRFYVVEGAEELMAMLDAPLERWRIFLHPSQREIVEMDRANGPVRVLGGPGTGKTVVAMHRSKWLVDNFTHEKEKVLFTTFNRNMAADIRYNLGKLCSESQLKQIEVINLDAWVSDFLKDQDYHFIPLMDHQKKKFWDKALEQNPGYAFSQAFLAEEYEKVVAPQQINSLQGYIQASRIGRGRRISRQDRVNLWPVFNAYQALIREKNYCDFQDLCIAAQKLIKEEKIDLPYKSVIVDEAQDISPQAFMLLRAIIPEERKNDLFITGDGHQRIYDHKVVLSHCGINIRGRSKRLKINYRTTEEIRNWSTGLLAGCEVDDLDEGQDSTGNCISLIHGLQPVIHQFSSQEKEMVFLKDHLLELESKGVDLQNVCLTARVKSALDKYQKYFEKHDLDTYRLGANSGDDQDEPGLRLATMHRVKGLEFDTMIVAGANDKMIPLSWAVDKQDNETSSDEKELQERCLLYVATTRAKKTVMITGYGTLSRFVSASNQINVMEDQKAINTTTRTIDGSLGQQQYKLNLDLITDRLYESPNIREKIAKDFDLEGFHNKDEFVNLLIGKMDQVTESDPLEQNHSNKEVFKSAAYAIASNSRNWSTFLKNENLFSELLCDFNPEAMSIKDPDRLLNKLSNCLPGITSKSDSRAILNWAELLRQNPCYFRFIKSLGLAFRKLAKEYQLRLSDLELMICLAGYLAYPPKNWKGDYYLDYSDIVSIESRKLPGMGYPLASEFFRNMKFAGFKPDRHIIRLFNHWFSNHESRTSKKISALQELIGVKDKSLREYIEYSLLGIAVTPEDTNLSKADNLVWCLGAYVEKRGNESDTRYWD